MGFSGSRFQAPVLGACGSGIQALPQLSQQVQSLDIHSGPGGAYG